MTLIASIVTFSKKKKKLEKKNDTLDPRHGTLALDMKPSTLDPRPSTFDKKIDSSSEQIFSKNCRWVLLNLVFMHRLLDIFALFVVYFSIFAV